MHCRCRAGFKHTQISLGNDNTQGRPADFLVFNGVNREWEHDVEEHGNTGHNQVFLNIGEIYHAWIMVQVSLFLSPFSGCPGFRPQQVLWERLPACMSVRQMWHMLAVSGAT